MLRVLEGALAVSEYTDKVDVFSYRSNKLGRIQQQLGDMFAVLSGMLVAAKGKKGQDLIQNRQVSENPELFASIFEVGRRYKVMNPDKMRSSHGKLMYMLMDASMSEVRESMGFSCVRKIVTVEEELRALGAEALLDEEDLDLAVAPVHTGSGASVEDKAAAMARLVERYGGEGDGGGGGSGAKPQGVAAAARKARVERVLLSIADDAVLTEAHVAPVEEMLQLLRDNYSPSAPADKHSSLAISAGRNGARLSHSHSTQYAYVEQSLLLWREILTHLSRMWSLAEADLLDGSGYRLRDTGQGVHRVASAPQVGRFMQDMLSRMQQQVRGNWVGSSAVHLGDNDVPNALVWIDKYTQIPRILSPVLRALADMDELVASTPGLPDYVESAFGSVELCKMAILTDFFRHAFDGSGADNFYDAGSCIDGRLTSAWNWCSKISKKSYFSVFKMAGFVGFDGHFNK